MSSFWLRYQQGLQRCCTLVSPQFLQLCCLLLSVCTVVLFFLPQRSEWLLLPLLLLLWCLLLRLAQQALRRPPAPPATDRLLARLGYQLRRVWYQGLLLAFLLLCGLCLAFSLKFAGVILRAILA